MGAKGSFLVTREAQLPVPAMKAGVADTIGAGDSYMAAGYDSRVSHRRRAWNASRESRQRAASITVSRPGALLPSADELQTLIASHPAPGRAVPDAGVRACVYQRP